MTDAKNLHAAKVSWEQTEGRCSCVLGEEVWEGLSWRRGIFLFGYIRFLLEETQGENTKIDKVNVLVSRELFAEALQSFHMMLIAQGPITANLEDHTLWQVASDGAHQDETARMYYHGIYTSTHLRGLKHLAELCYWQWKHGGLTAPDARLAAFVNRKFAHVVGHIMPHAGWTADIEYERVLELESATLETSEFSNGLGDKPMAVGDKPGNTKSKAAAAPEVVTRKSESKSAEATAEGAGYDAKRSVVPSAAPETTAVSPEQA